MESKEKQRWECVRKLLSLRRFSLGKSASISYLENPIELGILLSRYKFAAKILSKASSILEFGCGEGVGSILLAEHGAKYVGVDEDLEKIGTARELVLQKDVSYLSKGGWEQIYGSFEGVVFFSSEPLSFEMETDLLSAIFLNLSSKGICMLGTPNDCKAPSFPEQISSLLKKRFHQVFRFVMNEEMVQTTRPSSDSYLLFLCCHQITPGAFYHDVNER